jgi:hypothetical protein
MSWPEHPQTQPLEDWRRHVIARGQQLRRRRHALIAGVGGMTASALIAVPLLLGAGGNKALDQLVTVNPTATSTPSPSPVPAPTIGPPSPGSGSVTGLGLPAPFSSGLGITGPPMGSGGNGLGQRFSSVGGLFPSSASPQYAMTKWLQCTHSHDGFSSCPGSSVILNPRAGEIATTAFVQMGQSGAGTDYNASDTANGTLTVRLYAARSATSQTVTVSYREVQPPTATSSPPGNNAADTLAVSATSEQCTGCTATVGVALQATPGWCAPGGTVPCYPVPSGGASPSGTLTLTVTNPSGDPVPSGWITIRVISQSFATIGLCDAPCGEMGAGNAKATADNAITRIRLG